MFRTIALASLAGAALTCAAEAGPLRPMHAPELCLDVKGGTRQPAGAPLIVFPCHGGRNQSFYFSDDGTIQAEGRCLDIAGGAARPGDRVILWPCHGRSNQRWRYSRGGRIVGQNNLCLDVADFGGAGARVIVWPCKGPNEDDANQRWIAR